MTASKYQIGQKYGLLTLLSPDPAPSRKPKWKVQCDCGFVFVCRADNFTRLNPKCRRCGIALKSKPHKTHGQSRTPMYQRWAGMVQRCHNLNSAAYHKYGGCGISVYLPWQESFAIFIADMGLPPDDGIKYSIERKDNNGNYEPNNCVWDTPKRQARNTRTNHLVTIKDQTKTIAEWAEISGVNYDTIFARIEAKWPVEYILLPPIYKGRRPFLPTQP